MTTETNQQFYIGETGTQAPVAGQSWRDETDQLCVSGAPIEISDESRRGFHGVHPSGQPRRSFSAANLQDDKSVGLVKTPYGCATGFRVGADCIMTALHVLSKTTNEMGHEISLYRNKTVYIKFNSDSIFQFNDIAYAEANLDTAVIQLYNPDNKTLPRPLRLSSKEYNTSTVSFVAFNNGKEEVDENCPTCFPNLCDSLKRYSDQLTKLGFPADGYKDLNDSNLQAVKTRLRHGASGGPGIIQTQDQQELVIMMLIKGFPYFYFGLSPDDREKIPDSFLIQAAIKLRAVHRGMMTHPVTAVRELTHSIFSDHQSTDQVFRDLPENQVFGTMDRDVDSGYTTGQSELGPESHSI